MPRILVAGFCAAPGPDRIGVQLGHVIRALARHHTVDVLVVRRGDQAYVERFASARLLRVPVPDGPIRSRIEAFRRALRRQLEGAEYDLCHFRDGWAGVPILDMQSRLRYATVFDAGRSPLGEPPVYDMETATELQRDELDCVLRSDLVLAATEPARQYFASLVPTDRVRLVPPGVDVDAFDWDTAPSGAPRVVYAGALTPGRGVRVLLRAMLDVAAHSEARLLLAGRASPEFFESLQTAVRDLGLGDRVQLLGEVPHEDVPALIASASVCVAPGAVDLGPGPLALYPTKILEYMACQRAVVAPRRGAVSMLIRDEQHGLLFEPGQPIDLATKILQLLADAEQRGRLARAGYELVRRGHTASATRRELRRAYAWLGSISPWRERFAALLEELPTRDMPVLVAADPTGPGGWIVARGPTQSGERPIAAFEGDVSFDELTDSGQVDTGLTEGFGEVTKVETSPILGDEDRAQPVYVAAPPTVDTSTEQAVDEWVVDDSRIRSPGRRPDGDVDGAREGSADRVRSGPARERHRQSDRASTAISPVEASFVAGEVEVPTPIPARPGGEPAAMLDAEHVFTALGSPLGFEARPAPPSTPGTAGASPAERVEPPRPAAPASLVGGGTPSVVIEPELRVRVGTEEDTGP